MGVGGSSFMPRPPPRFCLIAVEKLLHNYEINPGRIPGNKAWRGGGEQLASLIPRCLSNILQYGKAGGLGIYTVRHLFCGKGLVVRRRPRMRVPGNVQQQMTVLHTRCSPEICLRVTILTCPGRDLPITVVSCH